MTFTIGVLLTVIAIQLAATAALLVARARRFRAERALRESEARVRRLLDRAPVMIWTVRPDATLDYFNGTCMEFTGLPIDDLLGTGWLSVVHPDDLERCIRTYTPLIEARKPLLMEYRMRRADGVYRWILDYGVPKYEADGRYTGYVGYSVDITERREAEHRIRESQAALQESHREIQHLAGRLIEAQDAERARIARDLHDDVSQQLAGVSIAFSALKRRMDELQVGEELRADLKALHERTISLARTVRHLSHDLHPTVLRHAGLVAALTSHCAEVERSHGIAIACSAEGDFTSIAPDAALCLYRIAQEALRNVIAHAGASQADVRLLRTSDHAEITIADDGKGFDVARSLKAGKGLGLVSIAERVRLAGGTVSAMAESQKGTRVHARIPAHGIVKTEAGSSAEGGRSQPLVR